MLNIVSDCYWALGFYRQASPLLFSASQLLMQCYRPVPCCCCQDFEAMKNCIPCRTISPNKHFPIMLLWTRYFFFMDEVFFHSNKKHKTKKHVSIFLSTDLFPINSTFNFCFYICLPCYLKTWHLSKEKGKFECGRACLRGY